MPSTAAEFINSQIRKFVGDNFNDYFAFVEPFSIGDAILDLSIIKKFKEKNKCKIIFICSPYVKRIESVFDGIIDKWIVIDNIGLLMLYAEACCKDYDLSPGNFICMAPALYGAPFGSLSAHVNESYLKKCLLGLNGDEILDLRSDDPSGNDVAVDNFVLILPHAQSAEFLGLEFWQKCVDSLNDRYNVIVDDFPCLLEGLQGCQLVKLNFSEILAHHRLSKHTISYRSGMSDLIATSGKEHFVIYPVRNKLKFGYANIKDIRNTTTVRSGLSIEEISLWDAPENDEILKILSKI
jgi:hypothetical protein